jgi:hypothetical protein
MPAPVAGIHDLLSFEKDVDGRDFKRKTALRAFRPAMTEA